MRSIGVVTGSRADYGIYLPILKRVQDDKYGIADTYRSLGLFYAAQGNEQRNTQMAREYLVKARDIFEQINAKAEVAKVEIEFAKLEEE